MTSLNIERASKRRLLSKQTYKRGAFIKAHQFPTVPSIAAGSEVKACELIAQGTMEFDGQPIDFVELRIFAGKKS